MPAAFFLALFRNGRDIAELRANQGMTENKMYVEKCGLCSRSLADEQLVGANFETEQIICADCFQSSLPDGFVLEQKRKLIRDEIYKALRRRASGLSIR